MAKSMWLPTGAHTDLNIEHVRAPDTGSFINAGLKLVWHITVSPWMAIDAMVRVLLDKSAYPQIAIGGRPGFKFPVVVQFLPLDHWGKALAHPGGTSETNKAGCVQVEICARPGNVRSQRAEGQHPYGYSGFDMPDLELPESIMRAAAKATNGTDEHRAAVLEDIELCMHEDSELARAFNSGVKAFTDDTYKALANLTMWIDHRVDIPRRAARTPSNPARFSPSGFIAVGGHCGHMHVPNNNHYDPTSDFRLKKLLRLVRTDNPYDL